MQNRATIIALLLLVLLPVLSSAPAGAEEKAAEETVAAITIVNSGSTNMRGYTIAVMPDGAASWRLNGVQPPETNTGALPEIKTGALPRALAQKLFSDVRDAQPLDGLEHGFCAKSASFGTTTTIAYGDKTSPDISCGGNSKTAPLYADVRAVQNSLGITPTPRHRVTAVPVTPAAP